MWRLQGTVHLVDAAKQAGVKKFILMSSLLTNGRAAGQGTNPNFVVLNLFGGVLDEKLKVSPTAAKQVANNLQQGHFMSLLSILDQFGCGRGQVSDRKRQLTCLHSVALYSCKLVLHYNTLRVPGAKSAMGQWQFQKLPYLLSSGLQLS